MSELVTLVGERVAGILRRDRAGRVGFVYDEGWRRSPEAYPVSLSMPLAAAEHGRAAVNAYLWGLLPDNERVLDRWAKQFHVSARSAFSLLSHVGQDCAGAVRFVDAGRAGRAAREQGRVEWLTAADVGARLRALREDAGAWRRADDVGQFSLAGAQPKTALLFDRGRWGVPSGRIATTHILKPGSPGLDGHAENEHFCLALAGELGLPVVSSRVARFEDEVAVVVERYDRLRRGGRVVRVHQEDVCQALAVHPDRKYESDGGPGAADVVGLLRAYSAAPEEDVATFVGSLALHWIAGGTDAHAKNYSILIGEGRRVRLAPLYDVASALTYHATRLRKLKLAMKVGGKYRLHEIGLRQWGKLASQLRLDPGETVARVRRMAAQAADLAASIRGRMRREGVGHEAVDRLAEAIAKRGMECAAALG